jgi:hypothetical protein
MPEGGLQRPFLRQAFAIRQFGQSTKFQLDLMRFYDTLVFVLQDTGRDAGPNLSHQAARPITDNSAALPRVARACLL